MIRLSIKSKLTIAVSLLMTGLLIGTGLFGFIYFRKHLKETISDQQFTLVSTLADELDGKIRTLQEHILAMAKMAGPEILRDRNRAGFFLRSQEDNRVLFDNGLFLFSPQGAVIAAAPEETIPGEWEDSVSAWVERTRQLKAPQISTPFFSHRDSGQPVVMFTAPVLNRDGGVAAVLAGSLDLWNDNLLGHLAGIKLGKEGSLCLFDRERSLLVHRDRSRILRQKAPDADGLFERALEGFEGTGEAVTLEGIEALSSYKHLQTTGWILVANYPIADAFAPIEIAGRTFTVAIFALLLLASAAVWLLMRHLTAPLSRLTAGITSVKEAGEVPALAEVASRDEIGALARAFGDMLSKLAGHQRLVDEQLHFLQVLIDTLPSPIFYKDIEGRYLGCNGAFETFIGIARQDLIGKTVYDIAPAELADVYRRADDALFALGPREVQVYETSVRYADGTPHEVIFYKAVFPTPDGRLGGLIGTVLDITERKRMEKELAEQRQFSEKLLEFSAAPTFVIDSGHRVIAWNRACEQLTGLPAGDLLGTSDHWRAFYPARRPCLADFVLDGNIDQLPFHYKNSRPSSLAEEGWHAEGWIPLSGSERYLTFNAAPIRNGGGKIAAVIQTFEDITSQQRTLEKLSTLSLAVEQSPDTVIITDSTGAIEYVNPRFTAVTGYRPEEVIGRSPSFLRSGELTPGYYRTLWETIAAGHEWRGELHNRKKSGEPYWENALISPLKGPDDAITHFVAVTEDITGKKVAERRQQLSAQVLAMLSMPGEKTDKIRDILQLIKDFTGFEAVNIRLRENSDFPFYSTIGVSDGFLAAENRLLGEADGKPGEQLEGLCGNVLSGKTGPAPFFSPGGSFWTSTECLAEENCGLCSRGRCFREGFRSMALIPLRSGEEIIGLLQLCDSHPGRLTADQVSYLEGLAASIGIAFEHRQTAEKLMQREERLHFLTNYDPLTHLPNRLLLQDRLRHAIAKGRRSGKKVALLQFDLDRFKTVNDSLGHEAGDRLLCEVAERLRSFVREVDTLARVGGDEFAIVLEEVEDPEKPALVARKVLDQLSRVIQLDEYPLYLSAGVGISVYPSDGDDAQTLMKYAEVAMYRAKETGANNYQFYRPEMNARSRELLLLESSLRQALENRQLILFYQPKIDLATGRMAGVEALIRWRHPQLGMVSPGDFIPLAEETGLIVPIGEWVLRTACAQALTWATAGSPIRIAVNISGRQFKQPDFVQLVARILRETGLPSSLLELEITESVVMEDVEATVRTLANLKEMGLRLAVDDFGTGYSSLSYLKRFPIDCLKIDRSFVREVTTDPNDAAIAESIVALARAMKHEVVAEGVETKEQLHFLNQIGCASVQGFFFSRPLPPEELEPHIGRTDWMPPAP